MDRDEKIARLKEVGVVNGVFRNMGICPTDATDEDYDRLLALSPDRMFERYLNWNGIIGHSTDIREAVHAIDEALNG